MKARSLLALYHTHSVVRGPSSSRKTFLSMCISTAQVQSYNDAIPTFHNLIHLRLDSLNYRWNFLVEVLKHCPKLQALNLDEDGWNSNDQTWTKKDDKENWKNYYPHSQGPLHYVNLHLFIFHVMIQNPNPKKLPFFHFPTLSPCRCIFFIVSHSLSGSSSFILS
ncbi:hypothetical protein P8452_20461 [Trifolium repens]|nr:hypothetical protein P8452_20461 [Trifolium repens]